LTKDASLERPTLLVILENLAIALKAKSKQLIIAARKGTSEVR